GGTRPSLSGDADAARSVEQLLPGAELDSRATEGLAARALVPVDRLPPRVGDDLEAALLEQRLQPLVRLAGEQPGPRVLEQELDGLGRVLLVRPDHAGRASLDPAGDVEPRRDSAS